MTGLDFGGAARKTRTISIYGKRAILPATHHPGRVYLAADPHFPGTGPARNPRQRPHQAKRRAAPVGGLFAGNKLPMRFPGTRVVDMDKRDYEQIQHKPTVYRTVGRRWRAARIERWRLTRARRG